MGLRSHGVFSAPVAICVIEGKERTLSLKRVFAVWIAISTAGRASTSAGGEERADGMRFVPDIAGQFFSLSDYPEPLGLHRGGSPNPSSCKHYQAITRVNGPDGTPFFLVTRSGNTPDVNPIPGTPEPCDDSPGETDNGHLIVFRMDSRDKNGERIRSNRLLKGVHVESTAAPLEDKASIYFTVIGGDPTDPDPAKHPGLAFRDGEGTQPPRVYQHPGGMQLVGHMLAIAVETRRTRGSFEDCVQCLLDPGSEACQRCINYDRAPHPTAILFFDVTDPEAPVFKSQFAPHHPNGDPLGKAGVVAVTPLPGGRYLMAVAGGDGDTFFFYRSTLTDLRSPDLSWELVDTTPGPGVQDPHQTLNFLREGNIEGDLYLAGARGRILSNDRDRIDLYRVDCETKECVPGESVTLTVRFNGKRITPFPATYGLDELASLAAGSGFYVSPSGELIFYATEHDNDGPSGTVKAGEWRHRDMVREGSPTVLPSAAVDGPHEVDEGGGVTLSGSASPPATRAWIQLYEQTDFGPGYVTVDFDDRLRDDFDDFTTLEPLVVLGNVLVTHNDKTRSWKWFAPPGCSIFAIDRDDQGNLDEAKTLVGTGSDADLALVLHDGGTDDIDQEIDAVEFLQGCDGYYATPVALQWDLDLDGTFESAGSPVTFSAATLDGPSVVNVPAQAQHPLGGPAGPATSQVTVRNVAPQITLFRLTDAGGNEVNVSVPFVLTGLPLTVGAQFIDPGRPDHQTATLSWGDGAVDVQSAFALFDEAFGDGAGEAVHAHSYSVAGSFPIGLSVADDDGGTDVRSAVVQVLTPEQAVEQIVAMLDALIATTADNRIRKDLEKARKALAGNPGANNGALRKIREGQDAAAIAFLNQAADRLRAAGADGANTATLVALVEQVVAALSAP